MPDITQEAYDKAFRLFCAARNHFRKGQALLETMDRTLGYDSNDWVRDLIFSDIATAADFMEAVKKDGYEVRQAAAVEIGDTVSEESRAMLTAAFAK